MLPIAKVLKSHGTDGGILIGLRGIEIEEINLKEPVFIHFDGLPVPFFFLDLTPKGSTGRAVAHLSDVSGLDDAEEIVGQTIYIDAEGSEGQTDETSFEGWTVFDRDRRVGMITGMEPIPGNLCLYIGKLMIPLHEDFILEADPVKRELHLRLPEGILDI